MTVKKGEKINAYFRADFDFNSEADRIKHCKGFVICKDVALTDDGSYTFSVHSVIVQKLIAVKPDFEKVEQLAIKNCKLFDDEIIDVGSLAEHREKRKVEACKVCDNNCNYCKFDCNCSTEVEI